MLVTLLSLKPILQNAVCEVKFFRRRPKIGKPPTRRMLCTNCPGILNTIDGRVTLNYKPAGGQIKFNPDQKNLIITWDVFMQDYRCINVSNCELIASIPQDSWWEYFKNNIVKLSTQQKIMYMDS